ncbi:MAG: hypothetical protein RLZZ11_340 [Cyanobacteriota bacterium]|jgi:pimeloyl-ACP methyl ester carboxylesterase
MEAPVFTRAMASATSHSCLHLPAPGGELVGDLIVPAQPGGLVIFCHGSGSNRFSPRNRQVAQHLQASGLATLLVDLETRAGSSNGRTLASLPPLQRRLLALIDWTHQHPELRSLPLGLYGASTGAALALAAAADRPERVAAVVSRGGRPDLVFQRLDEVRCPVLLIVGSHDVDVLELNAWAAAQLQVRNELVVIPQASHLFAEAGALEAVAEHSSRWFLDQFSELSRKASSSTAGLA